MLHGKAAKQIVHLATFIPNRKARRNYLLENGRCNFAGVNYLCLLFGIILDLKYSDHLRMPRA